ncbi:MAG: nuclear transport factor 2 family protein [Burkholderiaceae bacterium]|nr:nuclear transport factor 2 family protein [Desulfobacterales bacterium]MDP3134995.1 nuclear transport factor 2 family protein [Burkholderiaceae bacterium]
MTSTVHTPEANPAAEAVARAIADCEQARRRALLAGDRAQVDQIFDDRLFYRHANGKVDRKDSFMASFGPVTYLKIDASEEAVTVAGDTAVASMTETIVTRRVGVENPSTFHVVAINVWAREGAGPWRLLSRQASFDSRHAAAAARG